jgi:hypothetical protein
MGAVSAQALGARRSAPEQLCFFKACLRRETRIHEGGSDELTQRNEAALSEEMEKNPKPLFKAWFGGRFNPGNLKLLWHFLCASRSALVFIVDIQPHNQFQQHSSPEPREENTRLDRNEFNKFQSVCCCCFALNPAV